LSATVADDADSGIDPSTLATLQQIRKLREREAALAAVREQAEEQMLHRLGIGHQAGRISNEQLFAAFDAYRALEIPGRSKRWNEHIAIKWQRIDQERRWKPNGPEGTWVGVWPIAVDDAAPIGGTAVVYILFDATNEPCYVGSTGNLRTRLKQHSRAGKQFSTWQAYLCSDREAAYQLEERLLAERFPRLNKRAGR